MTERTIIPKIQQVSAVAESFGWTFRTMGVCSPTPGIDTITVEIDIPWAGYKND